MKRQAPNVDSPETILSEAALQQGYQWSAEAFGIKEQQEISLSLHATFGPEHTHRHLAEVVPTLCRLTAAWALQAFKP